MPSLSASDYTQYLKFQAAAQTGIRPAIQTRDNVTLNPSVLKANILTSQASLVVNPRVTALTGNVRVQAIQPERTNNPKALSTQSLSTGAGNSAIQRPGGLPTASKGSQNSYTRLPQNAGWS